VIFAPDDLRTAGSDARSFRAAAGPLREAGAGSRFVFSFIGTTDPLRRVIHVQFQEPESGNAERPAALAFRFGTLGARALWRRPLIRSALWTS